MSTALPSEALLSAISQGRTEGVREALGRNADPEFCRGESTGLMMAASRGDADIVDLLLGANANANRPNRSGWTAIHEAAREGHTAVALSLAQRMIVPGFRDCDGWSALRAAIESGRRETAVALVEAGLNPDAPDHQGVTPLMAATDRQQADVVAAMVKAGGLPEQTRDNAGKSARDRAESQGWAEGLVLMGADTRPAAEAPVSVGAPVPVVVAGPTPEGEAPSAGLSRIAKRRPG